MAAILNGVEVGVGNAGSNGGGVGGSGLTEAQVRAIVTGSQLNRGAYDDETAYGKFQSVDLEHGFAVSRINGNLGNDPLADDGSNWILLMNGNRISEWWGRNQSEELPTGTIPANQAVTSEGVIGFTGTPVPSASENGGVPGITLVNISTVTDADPTVSIANSGIPIPPGLYEITAEFYGNQLPDDDVHIRWMEVMSGTDDIERLIGTQRQRNFIGTGTNAVHAHYEMLRKFRATSTSTYYFQLVNYTTGNNAQDRIAGYFQIERIA